jgi:hypothetical protein
MWSFNKRIKLTTLSVFNVIIILGPTHQRCQQFYDIIYNMKKCILTAYIVYVKYYGYYLLWFDEELSNYYMYLVIYSILLTSICNVLFYE